MVSTSIPKKRMMAWCIGSVITTGICFALLEIFYGDIVDAKIYGLNVISLPNEQCDIRPTLITVGTVGNYYPLMISLHRCGGVCGRDKPTFRACVAETSHNVYMNAFNKLTSQNETLKFENHTSCACNCVYDNSVCTNTQVWDKDQCKCVCAQANTHSQCPRNFIWNPNYCKCECDLTCNHKQTLNSTKCRCDCFNKYYKRCNRKNRILREADCKCYEPSTASGCKDRCNSLPAKWAALVIIISVCAIFIVAFDCILYCKSTGCVYKSSHMCLKDHRNVEERSQHETSVSDEVADIVHCRGVKV